MIIKIIFNLKTFFIFSLLSVLLFAASCNVDQQQACLQAVAEKSLHWLRTGGRCVARQYVHYTHLCTVSNYLPSVDYCCCALNSPHKSPSPEKKDKRSLGVEGDEVENSTSIVSFKAENEFPPIKMEEEDDLEIPEEGVEEVPRAALCCRYHQNWDHFRCLEAEDAIRISSPQPNTQLLLERFRSMDIFIVTLVLSSTFLVVLASLCLLKLWKCRKIHTEQQKDWFQHGIFFEKSKKIFIFETEKQQREPKQENKPPAALQYIATPDSEKEKSSEIAKKNGLVSKDDMMISQKPDLLFPCRNSIASDYLFYFDYWPNKTPSLDESDAYKNDTSDCSSYSSGEASEDVERHPHYSFYRRRILGMDARQPPCFNNSSNTFRHKNGFQRHYRRHSRHHSNLRHHRLKQQRHLSYCLPGGYYDNQFDSTNQHIRHSEMWFSGKDDFRMEMFTNKS